MFEISCMTARDTAPILISLTSLWVAIVAFIQSVPRLQLTMWVAQIYDTGTGKTHSQNYLYIQVVNTSKRPVTVVNVGANYNNRLSRWVRAHLDFLPKPRSFIWQDIQPLIFSNGKPRVLNDGESVSHQIQIHQSTKNASPPLADVKNICVYDAAGKAYYLSGRGLRNLKKQLVNINKA